MKQQYKKYQLSCLACLIGMSSSLYAQTYYPESKITHVTVYSDQAVITRNMTVNVEPGESQIVLKNLPISIKEGSFQISQSLQNASAKPVTFIDYRLSKQDRVKNTELIELNNQLAILQKSYEQYKNASEKISDRIQFITEIIDTAKITNTGIPRVTAQDLELFKQLSDELPELKMALFDANHAFDNFKIDYELERGKISNQIAKIMQQQENLANSLTLDYDIKEAGTLDIEVMYAVSNASWVPVYELRMADEKLALRYQATVTQGSGENWDRVNLALSTTPPIFNQPSEMNPWYIQAYKNSSYKSREPMDAPSIAMSQLSPAMDAAELYKGAPASTVESQGVNALFNIKDLTTVSGDLTSSKVNILETGFEAGISREVTPNISPAVSLFANIENKTEYPWLYGELNIFIGDQFVAKHIMPKTVVNDKLKLFLGEDQNILVKQQAPERFEESSWGNRIITETRNTTLQNLHAIPVTMIVNQQVPVTVDEKISVDYTSKPEWLKPFVKYPTKEMAEKKAFTIKDSQGILRGEIVLESKQPMTYTLQYKVTHPDKETINGF